MFILNEFLNRVMFCLFLLYIFFTLLIFVCFLFFLFLFFFCILSSTISWEEASALLRRDNFLQQLQYLDKDKITEAAYKKLTKFVNDPQAQPNAVASVSQAAEQLCVWLRAIHSYCTIFRQIQPKKNSLKGAKRKQAKVR